MMRETDLPKCRWRKANCFAMRRGYCMALAEMPDTENCEFFKTDEEIDMVTFAIIDDQEKQVAWMDAKDKICMTSET